MGDAVFCERYVNPDFTYLNSEHLGTKEFDRKGVSVVYCENEQGEKFLDTNLKGVFFDKLTFIYLEMPKFNKMEIELVTMLDKWMFVLDNLSVLMERPIVLKEQVFERLFCAAEI